MLLCLNLETDTKKEYKEVRAAEVMGPVDKGDRIMDRNGAKRVVNSIWSMSVDCVRKISRGLEHDPTAH